VNIQAARVEVSQAWSGPLPPPDVLAQYEQLLPGTAERILVMAEKSVTGRIDDDAKSTDAEIEAAKRGLSFAMRLTSAMTLAALMFFVLGGTGIGRTAAWMTAGGICLSVPVVMLIRSFIARS